MQELLLCYTSRLAVSDRSVWSSLRNAFWDKVCEKFPSSFCPKGKIDAGIDEFMASLDRLSSFRVVKQYTCERDTCANTFSVDVGLVCLSISETDDYLSIQDSINLSFLARRRSCARCGSLMTVCFSLPKFLAVSLPFSMPAGCYAGNAEISDSMKIANSEYALIGAINATGIHFFPTIAVSGSFSDLDNMNFSGHVDCLSHETITARSTLYCLVYAISEGEDACRNIARRAIMDFRAPEGRDDRRKRKSVPPRRMEHHAAKQFKGEEPGVSSNGCDEIVNDIVESVHAEFVERAELASDAVKSVVEAMHRDSHTLRSTRSDEEFHKIVSSSYEPCGTCNTLLFPEECYMLGDRILCYACKFSDHGLHERKQYFDSLQTGKSALIEQLNSFEMRFINVINVHISLIKLPGGQMAEKGHAIHFINENKECNVSWPSSFEKTGLVFCCSTKDASKKSYISVELLYRCLQWLKENNRFYRDADLSWIAYWRAKCTGADLENVSVSHEFGVVNDDYTAPTVNKCLADMVGSHGRIPELQFTPSKKPPVRFWEDDELELKGFVGLFPYATGSYHKPNELRLYFSKYVRWRLLCYNDNRFRRNLPYIFWCLSKFEKEILSGRVASR